MEVSAIASDKECYQTEAEVLFCFWSLPGVYLGITGSILYRLNIEFQIYPHLLFLIHWPLSCSPDSDNQQIYLERNHAATRGDLYFVITHTLTDMVNALNIKVNTTNPVHATIHDTGYCCSS